MPSFSKENNPHPSLQAENNRSSETEQIVQLKRLLVTLKQHYEAQIHQLQCHLQKEKNQKEALQREEENCRLELINNRKFHEEELQALREQQISLRDLFKKSQEELQKSKEAALIPIHPEVASNCQQIEELENLSPLVQEKEHLQEKYEQLKEEWLDLSNRLEEALEWRTETERHLQAFYQKREEEEKKLQDELELLERICQEKEYLKEEKEKMSLLLEENETRLKIAQQHLAKKVKETALLNQKIEEQQVHVTELFQLTESQKLQLLQLQSSLDLYQKQEKRLQEQLHEALKGTESHVMKWEEKYFQIYDKWQESEARVRELKKFEEKHYQMQSLLVNLGSFMGTSLSSPAPSFFSSSQDSAERRPLALDASLNEIPLPSSEERIEEKYDLFGMRSSRDKPSS